MLAAHPGNIVFQTEKVLCIRGINAGVKVIGTRDRHRRFVVVLRGTGYTNPGESKRRVWRGERTDAVVGHPNLIEKVRPEYVTVGQGGDQIILVANCRGAGQISAKGKRVRRVAEGGEESTPNRVFF